jgi:hypothetical protein
VQLLAAPREQQMAMARPPSVEQQVSAQRSIGTYHPPINVEDHEQLQLKVFLSLPPFLSVCVCARAARLCVSLSLFVYLTV